MSTAYAPGTTVRYLHQMPDGHAVAWGCGQYTHYGTVLETRPGNDSGEIVTVELDCGLQTDIPADDLQPVGD